MPFHPGVWLYDTTLRDGAQQAGITLSLKDKIYIAHQLDQLGIPFIEGGWPGANPKDIEFFDSLRSADLKQAELVAFCSTRHPARRAEADPKFKPVLQAGTLWVTLFGKSWDFHVTESLKTTLDENLAMISDSIAFLQQQNRRVIYDAEHWFDGYKHNPAYALATLKAAIAGGAEWLVLCDTNGGTLPLEIADIVQQVRQQLQGEFGADLSLRLGIHAHNDSGMAVANSVIAVQGGIQMVQGTINGYGERCGNADLCAIAPTLQLKLGQDCVSPEQLTEIKTVSHCISEIVNQQVNDRAPYVGRNAFAHKGGIHVSAVQKNPMTYEHIEPAHVGNDRKILVSEQAGLSTVTEMLNRFGFSIDKSQAVVQDILTHIKHLEHYGYQFEAAEASFELMVRRQMNQSARFFEVRGFEVHSRVTPLENACTIDSASIATVKVLVNGKHLLTAAEGNGPVSALDAALRKALLSFYPIVETFTLVDYKVRILDGCEGTSALTRVFVEFSNGQDNWSTIGVSGNIIEASYQAIAEGIEYGLLRERTVQSLNSAIAVSQP
jgi:2-isopropylmalate synthase